MHRATAYHPQDVNLMRKLAENSGTPLPLVSASVLICSWAIRSGVRRGCLRPLGGRQLQCGTQLNLRGGTIPAPMQGSSRVTNLQRYALELRNRRTHACSATTTYCWVDRGAGLDAHELQRLAHVINSPAAGLALKVPRKAGVQMIKWMDAL